MAQLTIQQAFNLAMHRHQAGDLQEAEQLYQQILALQPAHAGALHFLGVMAHQQGRNETAVDLMRRSIAISNNVPAAYNNLGVVLQELRRIDEAIDAFSQALKLDPGGAEAYCNLASTFIEKGRLDEAVKFCQQAIALRPRYAKAHNNLGNALKDQGQLDEAIGAYRKAIAFAMHDAVPHSNLTYILHFHPAYDAVAIARELDRWDCQHAHPLRRFIEPHVNDRTSDRPLRIGYVSPYFWKHCQSHFTIPLLSAHDRRQVKVFCYSDSLCCDENTEKLRAFAHVWRAIAGKSDHEVADLIRQDHIDILVDLTMHMSGNRLLVFARKRPVQICWLAYPGSTGLTAIDYRLSDPYLDPFGMDESLYSERTIRLPNSFWCYDPLDGRDIPVNALPAFERSCITFGCLNNYCKINNDILALWAQVMRQVEDSRFLMLANPGSHQERTLNLLREHEIDPRRVEFIPRQPRRQYLELYHLIDIGLDSYPYNGHTTSLDSFWMGVPVVTFVGQTAVSRAGLCQLSNLGLPELAAHSPEKFVGIAVALARNLPRLQSLRSTLRQRMEQSPLMDGPKFARNVEDVYRNMWRTWCKNGG